MYYIVKVSYIYLARFRTVKIVLFIAHIKFSVIDNKDKTCYRWFHTSYRYDLMTIGAAITNTLYLTAYFSPP